MFIITGCGVKGTDFYINLTPTQEELLYKEHEPIVVDAQYIKDRLPKFAYVSDEEFWLFPRGLASKTHNAPWCAPSFHGDQNTQSSMLASVFDHKDWDSSDYSLDLLDDVNKLGNYAFGISWINTEEGPFMVNIFIDEKGEVILYNPRICQFVRMEISNITIGNK